MAEFRMPSLGADMDSGTLIAWHMAVGDHVARGDIVAEVDTDKSVIDVETFTTGRAGSSSASTPATCPRAIRPTPRNSEPAAPRQTHGGIT